MMKSAPENRAAGTTVLIVASFHRYIAAGAGKPEAKRAFSNGMVVEASDIPDGHSGDEWVAKGLAKAV